MTDLAPKIVAIFAAGAVASLKDTAGQTLREAYRGLKGLLARRVSSLRDVERNPADSNARIVAEKELKNSGLASNSQVIEKMWDLMLAMEREPLTRLSEWGIDVSEITAAKNVVIREIDSEFGCTDIKRIEARTGNVWIEAVKSKRQYRTS
jgi:hypothetical protein